MQSGSYKGLKILFAALLAGQLLFAGLASVLIMTKGAMSKTSDLENTLLPVVVIVALICAVFGMRMFKARTQNVNDVQQSLTQRFIEYRAANILRWALLEGPCMFAIIGFMLTGNYLFLLITGILLLLFMSTAPKKEKVCINLGISQEELDTIV